MASIRPSVVIGFMALILAVVVVFEARRSRGDAVDCVVEEVLPGKKSTTLFVRCDGGLVKVPVPPVAALVHGTPAVGAPVAVLQATRGAVWDKPAARHALSSMLGAGFLVISAFLWWRRTA